MSSVPIPQLPLFRITLFYGPEPAEDEPARMMCVFNVKKRSWKGGVQMVVEVADEQVKRLRESLAFDAWMGRELTEVPSESRESYESRAHELFVQEICSMKLSLALDADGRQDNMRIMWDQWLDESDAIVMRSADRIKAQILTELDLSC